MSTQKAYQTLIGKEFRQNCLIYTLPFFIALIVFILIQKGSHLIAESVVLKLAIAIPVAIALAYGVQSFDLEEKGQTRDFLIVKPVSIYRIIWIKYITGFIMTFLGGLVWLAVLAPKIIEWPTLPDLKGFLFIAIILLELVVFSASFLFGVLMKGPVKIIGAVGGGSLAVIIFFSFWFELIKFLNWNGIQGLLSYVLLYGLSIVELYVLYQLIKLSTGLNLQNQMFATQKRPVILFLFVYLFFPMLFFMINAINPPVIIPYNPLSILINGDKAAFIAYHGAKCPGKNLYAVADYTGRLGLVEPGKVPVAVYQSSSKPQIPLSDITWSPDGSKIAFRDQTKIRVYSMDEKKDLFYFTGEFAMWSRDSQQLLIGTLVGKKPVGSPSKKSQQNIIQLSLADFKTKKVTYPAQLRTNSLGFCWDSAAQKVMLLNPNWSLTSINLSSGLIQSIHLPRKGGEGMNIFLVRTIPPTKNNTNYLFQIFSTNHKHGFNVDIYGFNPKNNTTVHQYSLKNVAYSDLIVVSSENKALYSTLPGVYRTIALQKAVE